MPCDWLTAAWSNGLSWVGASPPFYTMTETEPISKTVWSVSVFLDLTMDQFQKLSDSICYIPRSQPHIPEKEKHFLSCKKKVTSWSSTHTEKWVATIYRTKRFNRHWRKAGPLGTTLRHMNVVHKSMHELSLKDILILSPTYAWVVGRDSSVGIATRYGMDGQGIESRWRWDFPHPSRPALRPTQPPIQCTGSLSMVKRSECGIDHTPSSAEVKERVELYFYSPFGTSWPVLG
jgi:hypothetical protein